ncbi:hypothetical protein BUALT_Bualt02G0151800 [Buddleja alternifolia]|uniref:Uncharacterized protein n=1 Tax=Buddleja alternifolia TaxID=168488 RepID=A0AAV6Y6L9_9LAMI|nr:hypothetical protein BUALT_Bualt02G0151800 [Buddleja alternifolia]
MASVCIRLIVIVLCFCSLICMNGAISFTRSRNLMQKPEGYEVKRAPSENYIEKSSNYKVENTMRRMEIQLNDYPGSGANNRHTPRPHEP